MSRRDDEEFHARQQDEIFVCDVTFADIRVSWKGRGNTIAEAVSQAMLHAPELEDYGCGEYAIEIYSEGRDLG